MLTMKRIFLLISLLLAMGLVLAACGSNTDSTESDTSGVADHDESETQSEEADHAEDDEEEEDHVADADHTEDMHSPDDHMAGMHNVPEEAAAVPNPVTSDEGSIAAGAATFAASCAVCHGESGRGDGPAAVGLERPPSDLTMMHVQENTDGALFYIISHGRPETPMPAWDSVLDDTQRWQLVNFVRTLE